jgi:hypothetical protein
MYKQMRSHIQNPFDYLRAFGYDTQKLAVHTKTDLVVAHLNRIMSTISR